MCEVCRKLYCPPSCPEYDAGRDPRVTGFCRRCGEPLYGEDDELCIWCEEEAKQDDGDD